MKSPASAALISAEKTAARPRLPMIGGTPYIRIIGRASSWFGSEGNRARAMMPINGGTAAYSSSPSAFMPTPRRTARSSRAP